MARRSQQNQSKHDRHVKKLAERYNQGRYTVKADVQGYPRPDTLNGRRPDIQATSGKQEIIIEVETRDSIDSDAAQHRALQKYADKSKNRTFKVELAD